MHSLTSINLYYNLLITKKWSDYEKTLAVIILLFLTNCAYKPLVNPETSRDKWSGENADRDWETIIIL